MHRLTPILVLAMASGIVMAQQPPLPDTDAPRLTLEEKMGLVGIDVKKADALEKVQLEFQKEIKPLQDQQDALKKVIEQEHPGWQVSQGGNGYFLAKKEDKKDEKKDEKAPAATPAPKKK